MRSLSQKLHRQGTVGVKILFRVEVKKINFPHSGDLETDSEFSVCFERGGKIAASGDRPLYRTLDGSMEVMVNESLSLVVTMYRDQQSHQYQDKEGKLIIRQKKTSKKRGEYRGIGISPINLAPLCLSNQSTVLTLPIEQCSYSGATVSVTIVSKAIGECHDDALSLDSGFSEPISDIAADFEEKPRFRSSLPSLPAYPSSLPLDLPPSPLLDSGRDPVGKSSISSSNQFLALLTSHPELQKKWNEAEREIVALQEKYRSVLQQKTKLSEELHQERTKSKRLEEEIAGMRRSHETERSSDDRSLVSRIFSNVPDTPSTNDPPEVTPSKTRTKNSITFRDEQDTRSSSAEIFVTPKRSILKSEAYQAQSFKTPTPATSQGLPVRSLSTSRSVSFRNIRSSSDLVTPTPTDSASPRARTLPASQLSESLTDFNKSRPSPHTPRTPSRKQSLSGEPLPSLLLEENNKLQKELGRLKLFSQEMDSLNKENQIEIQFLVEGKRRLGQENKRLKEKYEAAVRETSELAKKLEESERRGRGRRDMPLIEQQQQWQRQQEDEDEDEGDREVREEILLAKIQLETENCELKDSYEKLEREYLKLRSRAESGCGDAPAPSTAALPLLATHQLSAVAAAAAAAQEKEIQCLREIIRCRDLQISLLCLPQSASPRFLQQFAAIPQPSSPEISPRKDTRADDLSHLSDAGRDSVHDHLTQELSQLIADSATLSQAPPVAAFLSPQPPADPNANSEALMSDMSEVVSDLISSKLRIASLSTELDVEVMKQKLLKSRLGKYATRVSQLEVENISLYSRINTLSTDSTSSSQESRSSWYPSWLRRYLD